MIVHIHIWSSLGHIPGNGTLGSRVYTLYNLIDNASDPAEDGSIWTCTSSPWKCMFSCTCKARRQSGSEGNEHSQRWCSHCPAASLILTPDALLLGVVGEGRESRSGSLHGLINVRICEEVCVSGDCQCLWSCRDPCSGPEAWASYQ